MPCPFPPLALFTVSRSLMLFSVLQLLASLFLVPSGSRSDRTFARVREPVHLLLASHLWGSVLLHTPGQGRAFARVLFSGLLAVLLGLLLRLLGLLISRLWDIVHVLEEESVWLRLWPAVGVVPLALVVLLLLLLPLSPLPLLREVALLLHYRSGWSWHRYERWQRRRSAAGTLRRAAGRALMYHTSGLTALGAQGRYDGPATAGCRFLCAAGVFLGPPAHSSSIWAFAASPSAALLLLAVGREHCLGLWKR